MVALNVVDDPVAVGIVDEVVDVALLRPMDGAVSGAVSLSWLDVSGDVGVNHIVNYQHVEGVHHTSIAGRIQFSLVWARIFGGRIPLPSSDPDGKSRLERSRPPD